MSSIPQNQSDADRLQQDLDKLRGMLVTSNPNDSSAISLAKVCIAARAEAGDPEYALALPDKPSGKECRGYSFVVDLKHFTVQFLHGKHFGSIDVEAAWYRWCNWDGRIVPGTANGELCPHCERTVHDKDLGTLPNDNVIPVLAVQVYLLQVAQWGLCQIEDVKTLGADDAGTT